MKPESETIRFFQTWTIIYLSLTYCFFIGKSVSPGKIRFLFILPVVCLFLLLPFRLTSLTFGAFTSFLISWLATFKLILFSFNQGPLSSTSISLLPFLAAGSLPIKINPSSKLDNTPPPKTSIQTDPDATPTTWKPVKGFAVRTALLSVLFKLFSSADRLHPSALMTLYCFLIYLELEVLFAVLGAAARSGLGLELEPPFNEPYRATSLQDFWGRRWNLVVSSILRPTVYNPLMGLLKSPLGRDKAQSVAILATFGVSGIMHQLIFYYFSNMHPTWEVTSFFLLHGVCVVAETAIARRLSPKWRVSRVVSTGLTIWFVMSTAFWLFFPEILKAELDVKSFLEYAALREFGWSVIDGSIFKSFNGIVSIQHFFEQLLLY